MPEDKTPEELEAEQQAFREARGDFPENEGDEDESKSDDDDDSESGSDKSEAGEDDEFYAADLTAMEWDDANLYSESAEGTTNWQ